MVALGPLRIGATRALVLLAAIAVGFGTGHLLGRRMPAETVRRLVLLVAAGGGIAAIIRGLT